MQELISAWKSYKQFIDTNNSLLPKGSSGLPYIRHTTEDGRVIVLLEPTVEGMLDWLTEEKQ